MNNMLLNYMTSIHFVGLYTGQRGIFSRNKKYIILLFSFFFLFFFFNSATGCGSSLCLKQIPV